MVTVLKDIVERVGYSRRTARHGQSGHTAFKRRHAVFQDSLRRIGQPAIDISGIAQAETVGGVLGVVEYVGGCLIDWHSPCVGCNVGGLLADMKLKRLEM